MECTKWKTTTEEAQYHIYILYIHENGITPTNRSYNNYSWYQLNFQVSLCNYGNGNWQEIHKTCLGILDITGVKYNIVLEYNVSGLLRKSNNIQAGYKSKSFPAQIQTELNIGIGEVFWNII